jgi:hypothetical protein
MGMPGPLVLAGWIVADLAATLEVLATIALLAGAIGLGIAVFIWARRWRDRIALDHEAENSIETYRDMLDDGLIDPAEFARIEARLDGQPVLGGPGVSSTDMRSGQPQSPSSGSPSTDVRPGSPPPKPPSDPTP